MQRLVLAICFLIFAHPIQAAEVSPHFKAICTQLIQANPSIDDYAAHFTEDFRKAIPLDYLESILHDLYNDIGTCTGVDVLDQGQNKYIATFHGSQSIDGYFNFRLNAQNGLIEGMLSGGVKDPRVIVQKWDDLNSAFQYLDQSDHLSATLVTSNDSIHLTNNSNKVFAIGSTFKLYILGKLWDSIKLGQHTWTELFPIHEEWKSLPSGTMQNLPAGTQVSLYQYAENMISISDNTAADHLLYLLGRENVESMLQTMGNQTLTSRLPFLSTLEMFKLKWALSPSETQNYLAASVPTKRGILENLHSTPRTQVGTNGVSMITPTLIDKLEWFGTTEENCKAMLSLSNETSAELRKVLSKSTPLVDGVGTSTTHWSYVGFKGGSEPGVLSMTYLLETAKGSRACVSVSWNNTQKAISQNRFFDLVSKVLKLSENIVP